MPLNKSAEKFDIAILGGGISGLGVAREASKRGLRVAVFEKGSICSQTSQNSLRIIHGGFRYLQSLNLPRVIESARAQAELLELYPKHVLPLKCLMSLSSSGLKSKYPVWAALKFYGALYNQISKCKFQGSVLTPSESRNLLPELEKITAHGMLYWQDAYMPEPASLVQQIVSEITENGGNIFENSPVLEVVQENEGLSVRVGTSDNQAEYGARFVINTLGPWVHSIKRTIANYSSAWPTTWCKVFNVVVQKTILADQALGILSPRQRLYFAVPRAAGQTALGTGQVPTSAADWDQKPQIAENVLAEFLEDFNNAYPAARLALNDIVSVEAGVLPAHEATLSMQKLYGASEIKRFGNYLEILSTKYTTFLVQARKTLEVLGL